MKMIDKYTIRVQWSEEDEAFLANCLEFPSLMTHGDTQSEAIEELREVLQFAIDDLRDKGKNLPVPIGEKQFKGNISLRVPPETHEQLFYNASEEQLSLNQYITTILEKNLYENKIRTTVNALNDMVQSLSTEVVNLRLINEELKTSLFTNRALPLEDSNISSSQLYLIKGSDENVDNDDNIEMSVSV